jgi:hypothetical protein
MKISIKYSDKFGSPIADDGEVKECYLVKVDSNSAIFRITTRTKYPQPILYSGNGFSFKTKEDNIVWIKVTGKFLKETSIISTNTDRYCIYLIVFEDSGGEFLNFETEYEENMLLNWMGES